MAKNIQHFPPVGSDERFDAIVAKGRKIRQRRQALFGAATGSVLAGCVALAVVFGGSDEPAKSGSIFANEGNQSTSSTTVAQTDPPAEMRVTIDYKSGTVNIVVDDPQTPIPADPATLGDTSFRTQQCVTVTLTDESGQPAAEGFGCRDLSGAQPEPGDAGAAQTVQLSPSDGLSVGCAAIEERSDPVTTRPERVSSNFTAQIPSGLAPGTYTATVEAVSGFGDGCPDNPTVASNQIENTAAAKTTVTVSP